MANAGPRRPLMRRAEAAEAGRLAEIRAASAEQEPTTALVAAEVDFLDRLAIPHGEDYFCLVAELDGRIVGYVIGGGSRDLDRKAHGEIYELVVDPAARRRGVGWALLDAAVGTIEAAAFAGTIVSAPTASAAAARLAAAAGFDAGTSRGDGSALVRYERRQHPPRRGASTA